MHNGRIISLVTGKASEEGLCSMELVKTISPTPVDCTERVYYAGKCTESAGACDCVICANCYWFWNYLEIELQFTVMVIKTN
jgi:hypothetical protein